MKIMLGDAADTKTADVQNASNLKSFLSLMSIEDLGRKTEIIRRCENIPFKRYIRETFSKHSKPCVFFASRHLSARASRVAYQPAQGLCHCSSPRGRSHGVVYGVCRFRTRVLQPMLCRRTCHWLCMGRGPWGISSPLNSSSQIGSLVAIGRTCRW